MFFVTTDTGIPVDKLFSRIFHFDHSIEKIVIKTDNVNALFYNCQKVELDTQTVIICGVAFPNKNETLKSALRKVVQKKETKGILNGNFILVVFNKDSEKNNSFFIIGDHHGTIPCFFSQKNGIIKISSVLHLFLLDKENYSFNEESLLDYLCLGYSLPGKPLWHGIEMLPKEKFLTVFPDKGQFTFKKDQRENGIYEDTVPFQSLKECATVFFETLREVINDEINSLEVRRMLLTGGSDTRILLSCMTHEQRNKLLYRTYDSPHWSSTNNDLLIAKLIAKSFNLRHESRSNSQDIKKAVSFPQSDKEVQYTVCRNKIKWISGKFGSELFGGASFGEYLGLDYYFSKRIDHLKDKLLSSLITLQLYESLGSPWVRFNQMVLSINSKSREAAFISQMLLRSQFTSIYSRNNVNTFLIPSRSHFSDSVLPYIDTRVIDFFLRCPREFLLNYSLYEYIFVHFADKRLIEIPFHSNMMRFVESLPKMTKEEIVTKNVGTKSKCNYKSYFENNFNPSFFTDTFLNRLSREDSWKIPEPFLSRICDLTCFLLGLQSK